MQKFNDENEKNDLKDRERRVGFLFVVSFVLINLPAIFISEEMDNNTIAAILRMIAFSFHLLIVTPIIIIKYKLPKDKLYWFGHYSLFGILCLFVFLFSVLPLLLSSK